MKRLMLLFVAGLLFSTLVAGQNTIKFLGIPIDGTKKEVADALKAKGYVYNSIFEGYTGEFNGRNVLILVQTVNNRVWRLAILDMSDTDENNIRVRYNTLLNQFQNNGKYLLRSGEILSDDEDISYNMLVNKRRYEASFVFKDETINGLVWYMIADGNTSLHYKIAMFYENLDNAANGDDL